MDVALANYPLLLRAARRLTAIDPEDIVQDVFVGLCEHPPASVNRAYLLTALHHRWADRARATARHAPAALPLADWLPAPGNVADEAATNIALAEALAALAGEPYAPVVVDLGLGYRYREAAARGGVSIMAIKSGVSRLRHGPLARLSPYR
jgi:DNA-directed RNA polymerase specialized sigma24 family protein